MAVRPWHLISLCDGYGGTELALRSVADNRPENLEILDPVAHGREHHLVHPVIKTCAICGAEFEPHKTHRKRALTCGQECGRTLAWRTRRNALRTPGNNSQPVEAGPYDR